MQKDESGAAQDVKNTSKPNMKGNSSALNNVRIFGPVAFNQLVDDSSGCGHCEKLTYVQQRLTWLGQHLYMRADARAARLWRGDSSTERRP